MIKQLIKMNNKIILALICWAFIQACNKEKSVADASGSFEAQEVIISSESTGTIKQFNIEEGQKLDSAQVVGYIDSTQVYLKKKQLQSQIQALLGRKPDIGTQLASLEEQLKATQREEKRISALVKADAATPKQLDDINAQVKIIQKQIIAQHSALGISSSSYTKETQPLIIQIEQVNDQLSKSKIVNPLKGTVLMKYTEANEMAVQGKALYKIADLTSLIFRAYVTGNQLPALTLDQHVTVLTDNGFGKYINHDGTITWISDQAEFTPKTIQTKEERANMVYAIKVKVPNDGSLKIGMYGELKFMP